MIFHPAIIALLLSSVLMSFLAIYSSFFAILIHRKWDLRNGSELQLVLERRTYLISTILTYIFAFQILSFFLYIFTADRLHTLFVGAMCAAGTLQVNEFGYPALLLKIFNCLLAGIWLILNHTDNRAFDYPLIRKKYVFLLLMAPLLLMEMYLQGAYFLSLQPNIITSCCGSLFSVGETALASELTALPPKPTMFAFYLSTGASLAAGVYFLLKKRGAYLFAALSTIMFLISIASILSFISVYFYELPTHHCPFCILQQEYGYIGYPLYASLFGSGIAGMGAGILAPIRKRESLAAIIPPLQKKLVWVSIILSLFFAAIVTYRLVFTDFILLG
ncbi:MAG: uncharacterized protein H6Q43_1294 [Deltaproteobacteria bacterium]|nr:uncharacterized protein [Deltaproteobacteria bacterium]